MKRNEIIEAVRGVLPEASVRVDGGRVEILAFWPGRERGADLLPRHAGLPLAVRFVPVGQGRAVLGDLPIEEANPATLSVVTAGILQALGAEQAPGPGEPEPLPALEEALEKHRLPGRRKGDGYEIDTNCAGYERKLEIRPFAGGIALQIEISALGSGGEGFAPALDEAAWRTNARLRYARIASVEGRLVAGCRLPAPLAESWLGRAADGAITAASVILLAAEALQDPATARLYWQLVRGDSVPPPPEISGTEVQGKKGASHARRKRDEHRNSAAHP